MSKCIICFESEPKTFRASGNCEHQVCASCLAQYILTYMESPHDQYIVLPCPGSGCVQYYQRDSIHTMGIFDAAGLDGWWRILLERMFFDSKGTCPYPDCGALFELCDESGGYEEDEYGECYDCYRPICLVCETQWHPGKPCENNRRCWQRTTPEWKIRKLSRENSILVRKVANNAGWTQCPSCKEVVMRTAGCNTIRCRCGREFCYRCGGISVGHCCERRCHNMTDLELQKIRSAMYEYKDKPENGLSSASK